MSIRTTAVLSGARRVESYAEGDGTSLAVAARTTPSPEADTTLAPITVDAPPPREAPVPARKPAPAAGVLLHPKRREAPATWGWRGRLVRASAGLMTIAPSRDELTHRHALTQIRSATWPRAVNVMVTNPIAHHDGPPLILARDTPVPDIAARTTPPTAGDHTSTTAGPVVGHRQRQRPPSLGTTALPSPTPGPQTALQHRELGVEGPVDALRDQLTGGLAGELLAQGVADLLRGPPQVHPRLWTKARSTLVALETMRPRTVVQRPLDSAYGDLT